MSIVEKTIALLGVLRPEDVRALTPAQRRRFADLCHYWAEFAEPKQTPPKNGVLADLRSGAPRHE